MPEPSRIEGNLTLKAGAPRRALLLGIVCGVLLTLICQGAWLVFFVWSHHMFIVGVNRRGATFAIVLVALVALGAVALARAARRFL
jgi:hypothetical protein